ncbi:MAG: ribbon-helix-helix protein, CopG family [Candidatus Omnitrophica bacterium]|nr:ribbon-helix-helix protein, CopG family [Candidatus Omnitrophota bacterium]
MHRTTVDLDDQLYRAVKRKAVDQGQSMRTVMEEALRTYLGMILGSRRRPQPKFGVYDVRIRSSLRREDIYAERLRQKISGS